MPEAYSNLSSPYDLMGKFIVGGNLSFNLNAININVPEQSVIAYQKANSIPKDKIYVTKTAYTNIVLDDTVSMRKNNAETKLAAELQNLVLSKGSAANDSDFDDVYANMLRVYEEYGGLLAYDKYTEAYLSK